MEIVETVDQQIELNPALNAERYLADATTTAFTRLDKPVDPSRVVVNPKRFVKPMTLSEIKKKLRGDPEYFHH